MALSAEKIDVLSTHLPYELDLLDYSIDLLGKIERCTMLSDADSKMMKMMAMDCFYLHARSLIEFYSHQPGKDGSRTAAASEFTRSKIDYPASKKCYSDKINDQVAHLNYARGAHAKELLSDKTIVEIKSVLDSSLGLFQDSLTDGAKGHWRTRSPRPLIVVAGAKESATNEIYAVVSSYLAQWSGDAGDWTLKTGNGENGQ